MIFETLNVSAFALGLLLMAVMVRMTEEARAVMCPVSNNPSGDIAQSLRNPFDPASDRSTVIRWGL